MKRFNKIRYQSIKNKLFLVVLTIMVACAPNDDGYFEPNNVDSTLLPQVDFNASQTIIFQGEAINFTNLTQGERLLYLWNFEEGSPSTSSDPNPEVTYFTTGTFNVTLKVRNKSGANEITKQGYIVVDEVPIQKQPQDPAVTVRLNFEENLGNEGSVDTDATTSGNLSYGSGIINDFTYVFDGTSSLTIPGYTGINGADARSITAWVKTSVTATQGLVHWGASGSFSRSSFKINSGGEIRFEWQGGSMFGTTNITDDQWHHVALSYDGTTAILYVDGVAEQTRDVVLNTGSAGETVVEIGAQLGGAFFDGSLDDVRIYEASLTAGDVQAIAQRDKLAVKLNFEGTLFNEGSKGEIVNSDGTQASEAGIVNELAYTFDGTNPLTVSGYTGVNGSGARTVSCWIKTTNTATQGVVHWGASGSFSRSSFKINSTGEIRFEWQGGNMFGTTDITDGTWHHVSYTYDGATVRIYVDGVEENTAAVVLDTGLAGETDINIGSQLGGSAFIGALDDVRVYESVLSAEAIAALSAQ